MESEMDSEEEWREREKESEGKKSTKETSRTKVNRRLFICCRCEKKFLQRHDLIRHLQQIHEGVTIATVEPKHNIRKNSTCPRCGKHFKWLRSAQDHIQIGCKEKPKEFWTVYKPTKRAKPTRQIAKVTEVDTYECDICQRLFRTHERLVSHQRLHKGDRPFKCHLCPNGFVSQHVLKIHIRDMHEDTGVYRCATCNETLASRSCWLKHNKVQHSDFRFKCVKCGEGFHWPENYRLHLRKHLGIRPFECGVCGKKFLGRADCHSHLLQVHLRRHRANEDPTDA